MASTCPKCGVAIEQDFGLVNCPGCGRVLAVDVDGNVQVAEPTVANIPVEEAPAEPAPVEAEFQDIQEQQQSPVMEESHSEPLANENAYQDLSMSEQAPAAEAQVFTQESQEVQEAAPVESESPQQEEAQPPAPSEPEEFKDLLNVDGPSQPVPLQSTKEALDEVVSFGNKDSSAGPLSYTVVIEGVDLAPTRTKLLEVFSEPQFGWDAKEMVKSIKSGRLALEGLTPAQAVMLLRLLRGINVQISWSQHVYS